MRRYTPFVLLLLFGLAGLAGAAEYTPASFNGTWRFDLERTRALYGEEAAQALSNEAERRVDMQLSGVSGGTLRSYVSVGRRQDDKTMPISRAELKDGALILHAEGERSLSLRILDADSLALCEGSKCGILVRIPLENNR